jgi:pimeloyl-ACP methyl ester carboxylesterase
MSAPSVPEAARFSLAGRPAFLILPSADRMRPGLPWVGYAPAFPSLPGPEESWMFTQFLEAGIAIAGIDVGESYGSPAGRALFTALHRHLVRERNLSSRPALLARSRGGLMHINWAAEHPDSVSCIAGIYPVFNLASYPGLAKACGAYGMDEAGLAAALRDHNPVDRLGPLARARVPILAIHGDNDAVVPLPDNSGLLADRYGALGGPVTLIVVPGGGHDYSTGWFESPDLVRFVIANAGK